jgi:DNA primase catalytic subunit
MTDQGDEVYCRYKQYKDPKDLRSGLVADTPIKIDIGAVFNEPVN